MTFIAKLSLIAIIVATGGYGVYQAEEIRERNETVACLKRQEVAAELALQPKRSDPDEANVRFGMQSAASPDDWMPASGDDAYDDRMRMLLKRVYRLRQWVDQTPGAKIPELRFLEDSRWFEIVARSRFEDERDYRNAARQLKRRAQFGFLRLLVGALSGYVQASHGQLPTDISQLAAYFVHPVDDAVLARYEMAASGAVDNIPKTAFLIRERVPSSERHSLDVVSINGTRVGIVDSSPDAENMPDNSSPEMKALVIRRERAIQATKAWAKYKRDHGGETPKDVQELRSYVSDPSVLEDFKLPAD